MRAWKMVEAVHVDAVAAGRLRIGTLDGYKNIENGRADPADGGLTINSGVLMGEVPEHNAALARMRSTNVGLMVNCTVSFRQPPLYAFCMSRPGCRYDPCPVEPKAMFQISDVHRFAELIAQANRDILGEWRVDYVRYEPRTVTALDAFSDAHPFIKDIRFQPEQEIRIIWRPRSEVAIPFVTESLTAVAELLELVSNVGQREI